jgi:predicted TIM-barrel fold metal-dependent hydrolase
MNKNAALDHSGPPAAHRVDLHHHIYPKFYLDQAEQGVRAVAHAFYPKLLEWTPAAAIETMDREGVGVAVTSISAPGIWFGDATAARGLARSCNEYGMQLARDYPGRFGHFAALPLPDVEGSLREIEYAFDVLGADGICLMSNYDDRWPGDPAFAPVFDELDRRQAVVFFHPVVASFVSAMTAELPAATLEFPFDTTRAIASLIYSGTTTRCPNIRFIFSHGGGAMPALVGRLLGLERYRKDLAARAPRGALHELNKFYFDVVTVTNTGAFSAMRHVAGIPNLLFGSDYPFLSPGITADELPRLDLDPTELRAIESGNARSLFPRLNKRVPERAGQTVK